MPPLSQLTVPSCPRAAPSPVTEPGPVAHAPALSPDDVEAGNTPADAQELSATTAQEGPADRDAAVLKAPPAGLAVGAEAGATVAETGITDAVVTPAEEGAEVLAGAAGLNEAGVVTVGSTTQSSFDSSSFEEAKLEFMVI